MQLAGWRRRDHTDAGPTIELFTQGSHEGRRCEPKRYRPCLKVMSIGPEKDWVTAERRIGTSAPGTARQGMAPAIRG